MEAVSRDITPGEPLSSLLVLAVGNPVDAVAVATARASGARVLSLGTADPRSTSESVEAVAAEASIERVLAVGPAFGAPERLRQRLATAATGVQLPGGGLKAVQTGLYSQDKVEISGDGITDGLEVVTAE